MKAVKEMAIIKENVPKLLEETLTTWKMIASNWVSVALSMPGLCLIGTGYIETITGNYIHLMDAACGTYIVLIACFVMPVIGFCVGLFGNGCKGSAVGRVLSLLVLSLSIWPLDGY